MRYELVDLEGATLGTYQTKTDAHQDFQRHATDSPYWKNNAFLATYNQEGKITETTSYHELETAPSSSHQRACIPPVEKGA